MAIDKASFAELAAAALQRRCCLNSLAVISSCDKECNARVGLRGRDAMCNCSKHSLQLCEIM